MTSGVQGNSGYQKKPESSSGKNEHIEKKNQNEEIYNKFKNEEHQAIAGLPLEEAGHSSKETSYSINSAKHNEDSNSHGEEHHALWTFDYVGIDPYTKYHHIDLLLQGDPAGYIGAGKDILTLKEAKHNLFSIGNQIKDNYSSLKESYINGDFGLFPESKEKSTVKANEADLKYARAENQPAEKPGKEVRRKNHQKKVQEQEAKNKAKFKAYKKRSNVYKNNVPEELKQERYTAYNETGTANKKPVKPNAARTNPKPNARVTSNIDDAINTGIKNSDEITHVHCVRVAPDKIKNTISLVDDFDQSLLETRAGQKIITGLEGSIIKNSSGEITAVSGSRYVGTVTKGLAATNVLSATLNGALEVPTILNAFSESNEEGFEQLGRSGARVTCATLGGTGGFILGSALGPIGSAVGSWGGTVIGEKVGDAIGDGLFGKQEPKIDYVQYYETRKEESKEYLSNLNRPKTQDQIMVENFMKTSREYCSMTPEQRTQKEKQEETDLSPTIANVSRSTKKKKKSADTPVIKPQTVLTRPDRPTLQTEPARQDNLRDRTNYNVPRNTNFSRPEPLIQPLNAFGLDNRTNVASSTAVKSNFVDPRLIEAGELRQWKKEQGRMMYMIDEANKNRRTPELRQAPAR